MISFQNNVFFSTYLVLPSLFWPISPQKLLFNVHFPYLHFAFLFITTSIPTSCRFPSNSFLLNSLLTLTTCDSLFSSHILLFSRTESFLRRWQHSGCNNVPCLQYRRNKLSKVTYKKLTILKILPSEAFEYHAPIYAQIPFRIAFHTK